MPRPIVNLKNRTFGPLVAIETGVPAINKNGSHSTTWVCECICGDRFTIRASNLLKNRPCLMNCNCERPPKTDWSRRRFNRLVVTSFLYYSPTQGQMWLCRCDCGNITTVSASHLLGNTESCGCLNKDNRATSKYRPTLPSGASGRNRVIAKYKRWAEERNLSWELSSDQFDSLVAKDCAYCGEPPSRTYARDCNGVFTYNGVDRVDNTEGYHMDNVVACCTMCNLMKRNYTKEEFLAKIERIYENCCAKVGV